MKQKLFTATKNILKAFIYLVLGGLTVLIAVFVLSLEKRPDLHIWHQAPLEAEYTAESQVADFSGYLTQEENLFRQLETTVYAEVEPGERHFLNRFDHNSLTDPSRWPRNWNRTFELGQRSPAAGVLLLHGLSDSPYSLHTIGLRLHEAGAAVIGLRLPGHGTAPSGLLKGNWQDMTGAVRLAMQHLQKICNSKPLYIVGYSNGSALALHYALTTLDNPQLPKAEGLVLISPAIGVTPLAALAVWQVRLGHLLGLAKLAWNSIEMEYDPYKYNSFAINAGDQVYRLTSEIQKLLTSGEAAGRLEQLPLILAFQTVVDATVSFHAVVDGLFAKLPATGHELVLFDINRFNEAAKIFQNDPGPYLESLFATADLSYTLNLITNQNSASRKIEVRRKEAGRVEVTAAPLDLEWPVAVHSLSHVALPFPEDDPLYGVSKSNSSENPGIRLGNVALRGERGVLRISADALLRLRWNPFYPYVEQRVLEFVRLQ